MSVTVPTRLDQDDLRRRFATLFRSSDREFLPPALQIIEAPPSPIKLRLIQAICALAAFTIIWMCIGKIDVIAVAQGKIEPIGRVKLIQPLETGKIRDLFVANGTAVHEGQMLAQFDDSEIQAEARSSAALAASSYAEAARRSTAMDVALTGSFNNFHVDWPEGLPANILKRESRVLAGDLRSLQSNLASLSAQKLQKQAEIEKLTAAIQSQEDLLRIEEQRVELRAVLEGKQLGTKLGLLDAQETLQVQRTSLAQQKGQLAEAQAALTVLERDLQKAVSTFVAENGQKMADAQRQAFDAEEKFNKAESRTAHTQLRAPVSGVVQGLSITTKGQVVMAGEEIMRIVPDGSRYQVEAYVANKDIGFLKTGQDAIIKVEAFPFTSYGTLPARITRVSTEAIPEPDAQQKEANGASSGRAILAAGGQRVQNLVFPVTLALDKEAITTAASEIPVSNGMAVTVEVKTGRRRIIDYILAPILEVSDRALKER
jgi:hemolysin D